MFKSENTKQLIITRLCDNLHKIVKYYNVIKYYNSIPPNKKITEERKNKFQCFHIPSILIGYKGKFSIIYPPPPPSKNKKQYMKITYPGFTRDSTLPHHQIHRTIRECLWLSNETLISINRTRNINQIINSTKKIIRTTNLTHILEQTTKINRW